jgi:hypothetical protein
MCHKTFSILNGITELPCPGTSKDHRRLVDQRGFSVRLKQNNSPQSGLQSASVQYPLAEDFLSRSDCEVFTRVLYQYCTRCDWRKPQKSQWPTSEI